MEGRALAPPATPASNVPKEPTQGSLLVYILVLVGSPCPARNTSMTVSYHQYGHAKGWTWDTLCLSLSLSIHTYIYIYMYLDFIFALSNPYVVSMSKN